MKNLSTLSDLQRVVAKFRDERGWKKYHNPKNLVISILIEAAELAEHFQWDPGHSLPTRLSRSTRTRRVGRFDGAQDEEKREKVAAELSDVLWYCLSLADRLNIDMTDAFLKKFAHNLKKFPKDKARDVEFVRKQQERYRRLGK